MSERIEKVFPYLVCDAASIGEAQVIDLTCRFVMPRLIDAQLWEKTSSARKLQA